MRRIDVRRIEWVPNGKGAVEQIRPNESCDVNYCNFKFNMGNPGDILFRNGQEKERLNTIRKRKTSKS